MNTKTKPDSFAVALAMYEAAPKNVNIKSTIVKGVPTNTKVKEVKK